MPHHPHVDLRTLPADVALVPLAVTRAVQDGALQVHDLVADADVTTRHLLALDDLTERERAMMAGWSEALRQLRECTELLHATTLRLSEHRTTAPQT